MVDPEHRVSLWLVYLEQKKEFFKRYRCWEENQELDERLVREFWEQYSRNLDFRWYTAAGQPLRLYRPINFDKDVVILDTNAGREQVQEEEEEEHSYCCKEEIEDETCRAVFCFPGQSEVTGYTGNEGPTKTTTYHRSALVIWPEAQELQLGLKAGGLYGMAVCVRSKEREQDKKRLLSQVDAVLDTWTDMSGKLKKGEVGPVQRITDLLSKVEPHNVAAAYKHDLEELAEELTKCLLSLEHSSAASHRRMFGSLKELVVPWVKHHASGLAAGAKILEVIATQPHSRFSETRAIQLLEAFAVALQEKEEKAKEEGPTKQRQTDKKRAEKESPLQRPLQLLVQTFGWTGVGGYVLTLLRSSPSSISLVQRLLSKAFLELLTAIEAAEAIAQDTIDDVILQARIQEEEEEEEDIKEDQKTRKKTQRKRKLEEKKRKKKQLEMLHFPALVLCAAIDDAERGQQVSALIEKDGPQTNASARGSLWAVCRVSRQAAVSSGRATRVIKE